MCAINGFNWEDEKAVRKMNESTKHRGPDGSGIFLSNGISLGHNRLSIIDLSNKASQPMKDNDGNLVITYNGELYNFRELKKELVQYTFKTQSDTEVILAAYKKWGKKCVEKFNGIFAFAIWDDSKQEIFLARDHVGVKPLYYYNKNNKFIFSSEIKAILEHDIGRSYSTATLSHFFNLLYIPHPHTAFNDIFVLPQGTHAVFKKGELKLTKYWDSKEYMLENKKSKEMLTDAVEKQVRRSVRRQMISDKPVGIYLSGGIDSSVVLSALRKSHPRIETFSVGFEIAEGSRDSKFNKDFFLARKTAEYFNTNHKEVWVTEEDVTKNLENAFWHLDQPIASPTTIARFVLSRFAKRSVDVVLGGDGGDELFGGYDRYRKSLLATKFQNIFGWARFASGINPGFKKLMTPEGIERIKLFQFQDRKMFEPFVSSKILNEKVTEDLYSRYVDERRSGEDFEEVFMDIDQNTWLVDSALALSDKTTMAHGLESRVPLLDPRLVELARSIPLKYKLGINDTKRILKEAFRADLPKHLFSQPKRGWLSPGTKWLREPNKKSFGLVREILSPSYTKNTKYIFNWDAVAKNLEEHYERKSEHTTALWALIAFQIWSMRYSVSYHEETS